MAVLDCSISNVTTIPSLLGRSRYGVNRKFVPHLRHDVRRHYRYEPFEASRADVQLKASPHLVNAHVDTESLGKNRLQYNLLLLRVTARVEHEPLRCPSTTPTVVHEPNTECHRIQKFADLGRNDLSAISIEGIPKLPENCLRVEAN